MNKINKLLLPITILIASLILGRFYYASQVRVEESKEKLAKQEYEAKRRNECYNIYEREGKKWNNVVGVEYDKLKDVCIVKYKLNSPPKSKEECDKILKQNQIEINKDEGLKNFFLRAYIDCLNNYTSQEF